MASARSSRSEEGLGRSFARRVRRRPVAQWKLVTSLQERKNIMRKSLFAASMLALTVAVAPACATKKFVRTEVGNVNGKVDTLAGTVEETQERTRKNEERIGTVDQKAEAAGRSATEARAAADAAANAAKDVDSRLGGRITAVDQATRKLVFEVTLSEDQGNFAFGKAELPD